MSGLILVFDLDQTLVDSNGLFPVLNSEKDISKYMNKQIIDEVLRPAVKLKGIGVDAIFLLSNNASTEYVVKIITYLNSELNSYIFDNIMLRNNPSRPRSLNPPKRLEDVKKLLLNSMHPLPFTDDYSLARRTYFFDDNTKHLIREEFIKLGFSDHYIEIQGPDVDEAGNNRGFISGKPDFSDYRGIKRALKSISNAPLEDPPLLKLPNSKVGGRKTRSKRRKTIRRRKN